MKKLILPFILCVFTFTNASENSMKEISPKTEIVTTSYFEVNPFCKLIQKGDYEAVAALIKAGENVNKKSTGLTPLMFAARHNKAKIAELLIKSGAKLKSKSDKGKLTALEIAERAKAKDSYKVIKEALAK